MIVSNKKDTLNLLFAQLQLVKEHLGITDIDELASDDVILNDLLQYDDAVIDKMLLEPLDIGDVTIIDEGIIDG